ncbi:MAG: TRAP transporter fused permease subunit [Desulfurococcaceae archaeon]|nr:TRAP transporter fused permease subunit [Desulfurococcaceae archaeon]
MRWERQQIVFIVAVLAGFFLTFYELLYVMKLNFIAYSMLKALGHDLRLLLAIPDLQQSMALILAITTASVILLKPTRRLGRVSILYDVLMILFGLTGFLYIVYVYEDVVRIGYLTLTWDRLLMPLLAFIALIDASRRVLGYVLPALATLAVLLAWAYEGYNTRLVLNHFYYAKEGLFGIPLFVMVSYVFAFILFGSILTSLGVGRYITEFLLALLGRRVKGIAKLAVISSLAVGTVSGSSVANVMVTGTYTIPLSKRAGYPPHVAGAVEASASTGGQIAPPILGAAAFVMAEFLDRPYRDIMIAATIPALLYFFGVYVFIDRISKKLGLVSVRSEDIPPLKPLLTRVYLLIPIPLIALLLLWGLEPQYAALGSLGFVILLVWLSIGGLGVIPKLLFIIIASTLTYFTLRIGFSVASALFTLGVTSIFILLALSLAFKNARFIFKSLLEAFKDTIETVSPVFLAATLAGLIQGSLTLTGLAASIGFMILDLTGGNVFLVMVTVMLMSLVLGMGVPTTANYIITSTIGGAALAIAINSWTSLPLDSARLVAHMFVFYFGILADVTPPVALASYAASTLAKADFWKTALTATKLSLAGYLVPYIFALNPTLLILTVSWNLETVITFLLGLGGMVMTVLTLSAAIEGWHGGPIGRWERAILLALGVLNIVQEPLWFSATILTVTVVVYTLLYLRRAR